MPLLALSCSLYGNAQLVSVFRDGATRNLYAFCLQFSQVIRAMCGDAVSIAAPQSALDFAILASGYSAGCAALLKAQ